MSRFPTVRAALIAGLSTYDEFCDHLWQAACAKGLGLTHEQLREVTYPYADVRTRYLRGLCTLEQAEDSFNHAAHRHARRGRRISEVE